ncbi:Hypothetical predicted protein [Podarcis lilfordi]|uniref:Uncharacterized protein n=1 Tax=Podarcis lilfordi TaxID=74358 RepID=A0AA35JS10_9SAUR|nr:Hypothetical predicted protein [Podarcis lilfordi]
MQRSRVRTRGGPPARDPLAVQFRAQKRPNAAARPLSRPRPRSQAIRVPAPQPARRLAPRSEGVAAAWQDVTWALRCKSGACGSGGHLEGSASRRGIMPYVLISTQIRMVSSSGRALGGLAGMVLSRSPSVPMPRKARGGPE